MVTVTSKQSLKSLVLLCVLALASSKVVFTRRLAPEGWTKMGRAEPMDTTKIALALKQTNLDKLDRTFWAVSDPQSDEYQNFMSIKEIQDMVAPRPEHRHAVLRWLHESGVTKTHINDFSDCLEVTVTMAQAELMFSTQMFVYKHKNGRIVRRSFGDYSIPDHLAHIIEMIEGISTFPVPHLGVKRPQRNASQPNGMDAVVPQTLFSVYNMPAETSGSALTTTQGVIEFEGESYSPSDLVAYGQQVAIKVVPVSKTVGPNQPNSPQLEAELDIQFIATVNDEAANWFWLEPGDNWIYLFTVHFMNTATVPMVNSISYAWSEMDQCQINPQECQNLGVNSQGYVNRCNTELQKIALRGVSMLSASGDSGANGRTDEYCTDPYLKPAFPACSPYITSVGATQMNAPVYNVNNPPPLCTGGDWSCISGGQEVCVSYDVSDFTSGGGFSYYAAMPSYQTAAVNAYFKSGVQLPPASYYNASGRGYPDVTSFGHQCMIYSSGSVEAVGGTSCATPSFAAVASLLNQASIAKTQKPLGFLNPFLYQMWAAQPNTFNDITVGDNKCTESGCAAGCQGYLAYKGWDAVSGLGSPNVQNMISYIQNGGGRKNP